VTARPAPTRHWRSYGTDPLPSGAEALDETFDGDPSWFPRIECDHCGKVQMMNLAHMKRGDMTIRAIIAKMRHDGCGSRAGRAELLTGTEGASSRSVRRIVLREGEITVDAGHNRDGPKLWLLRRRGPSRRGLVNSCLCRSNQPKSCGRWTECSLVSSEQPSRLSRIRRAWRTGKVMAHCGPA
jgi:hypothetical protein